MNKNFCEAESPETGRCSLRFASIRKRCRYYNLDEATKDCLHIKIDGCGRNGCGNLIAVRNALRKMEK